MNSAIPLHTLAMLAAALAATLVLAGLLTPRSWWRRLTAGNVAITVGGTWAIAALLLHVFPAPATVPARAQQHAAAQKPVVPQMRGAYRVADALNLRASHGTAATRIAVVPAGAMIHTTGQRVGDWWQLRAKVDGKLITGWSNSLWLRRTDEAGMHVDVREHAN